MAEDEPDGTTWWHALISANLWHWQGLAVGAATILVMLLAPKVTRIVPAAILGLLAGVLTYFGPEYYPYLPSPRPRWASMASTKSAARCSPIHKV
jgi:hypothetical protein